nr:MAG TPA: hypothetical protein [Caudoviricetes sp.]
MKRVWFKLTRAVLAFAIRQSRQDGKQIFVETPVPADRLKSFSHHVPIFSNQLDKAMPKSAGEIDNQDRNPFFQRPAHQPEPIVFAILLIGWLLAAVALLLPLLTEGFRRAFS